jgi:hypothetical protein
MEEWIRDNFEVTEDSYLNEETWEYEDEFTFIFDGKEMGTPINTFISIFGEERPSSIDDLKSKVNEGQWWNIFDDWKEKGILN